MPLPVPPTLERSKTWSQSDITLTPEQAEQEGESSKDEDANVKMRSFSFPGNTEPFVKKKSLQRRVTVLTANIANVGISQYAALPGPAFESYQLSSAYSYCQGCHNSLAAQEACWNTNLCDICYDRCEKTCKQCRAALALGELCYGSGLCDRCYDNCERECRICEEPIELVSLCWASGMCDACYDKLAQKCKLCATNLDFKQRLWSTGMCDKCYNNAKFHTTCWNRTGTNSCGKKLGSNDVAYGTGLCDLCYKQHTRQCVLCKVGEVPISSLHWGTSMCDACYEECEKQCQTCGKSIELGQLHWGTHLCDNCYDERVRDSKQRRDRLPTAVKAMIAAQGVFYLAPGLLQPSLFLSIKNSTWGRRHAAQIYTFILTAASFGNMLAPVPFGLYAERRGESEVYVAVVAMSGVAGALIIFAPCATAFALSWTFLSIPPALRGVRAVYFTRHVPSEELSRVGQLSSASGLVGGILAPACTALVNWACERAASLDILTLPTPRSFIPCAILGALCLLVLAFTLHLKFRKGKRRRTTTATLKKQRTHSFADDQLQLLLTCDSCNCKLTAAEQKYTSALCNRCWDNYNETSLSFARYKQVLLLLFCFVAGLLELGMNLGVQATFQPIIVEDFKWGADDIALVNMASAVLSIIISLTAAWAKFNERQQALVGAMLYCISISLFTAPPLTQWRLVVGLMFGLKAQIIFMAPFASIFSRLLGRMRVTNRLTIILCLAPAFGGLAGTVGAGFILAFAGTWLFFTVSLAPSVVALLLLYFGLKYFRQPAMTVG